MMIISVFATSTRPAIHVAAGVIRFAATGVGAGVLSARFLVRLCLAGLLTASLASAVDIPTSLGNGADTYLTNDSNSGPTAAHGGEGGMEIRHFASRMRILYIRFDLSGVSGDLSGASITLNGTTINRDRPINFRGVIDGATGGQGEAWNESTLSYSDAAGLDPAAALNTYAFTSDVTPSWIAHTTNSVVGSNTTAASTDLDTFLAADTDDRVTFVVLLEEVVNASEQFFFTTKEGGIEPVLHLPNASTGTPPPPPPTFDDVDLWLIGDSTVNNNVNGGVGWGNVISSRFDFAGSPGFDVINRALGGRSSRSFYTQGQFQGRVVDFPLSFGSDWGAGDYLMIQFGHNDGGSATSTTTASLPGIGEETVIYHPGLADQETVHTYGWYLRWYVQQARDAGAIPIIAARVPRAGDTNETPSDYALWAQQVAAAEGVDFINLYSNVTAEYNDLRAANPGDPDYIRNTYFGPDATHTNTTGAGLNADFVATGIENLMGDAADLKYYLLNYPDPELQIREVTLDGGQFSILFRGPSGMGYSLQAKTDLGTGDWLPVTDSTYEQTSVVSFRFEVPIAGFDRRFFQVTGTSP